MKKIINLLYILFVLMIGIKIVNAERVLFEELEQELNNYVEELNKRNLCYNIEIIKNDKEFIILHESNGRCTNTEDWELNIEYGKIVNINHNIPSVMKDNCENYNLLEFWVEKIANIFNIKKNEIDYNSIFYKYDENSENLELPKIYGYYMQTGIIYECQFERVTSNGSIVPYFEYYNLPITIQFLNNDYIEIIETTKNSIKFEENIFYGSIIKAPVFYKSQNGEEYEIVEEQVIMKDKYTHVYYDLNLEENTTYYYKLPFLKDNKDYKFSVKTLGTPVENISLPEKETLKLGNTLILTPNITPENTTNKNVTWSSSDEEVATVDNFGKITSLKPGTTIITVTTEDGNKKATCIITVIEDIKNNNDLNTNNNLENKPPSINKNPENTNDETKEDQPINKELDTGISTCFSCIILTIVISIILIIYINNKRNIYKI